MNLDYYISLIYKQLKGEANKAEQKELAQWEEQSSTNRAEAKAVRKAWKAGDSEALPFEVDLDADFAAVQRKVKATSDTGKVVRMKPRRQWLQVAAGIAILAVATFVLRNFLGESQAEWQTLASIDQTISKRLPDGSVIFLNEGSTLSYPGNFEGNERIVKLDGEAFFEVTRDASKPFKVMANDLTVTVLGTQFNVQAKAGQANPSVAVKEGKVSVETSKTNQKVILTANEKAEYNIANKQLNKVQDKNLNNLSWQRNSLKFNKTALIKALEDVEAHFGNTITIADQGMSNCLLNARFKTSTGIDAILNDIATNYGMTIEKQAGSNAYVLKGGICKDK